MIGAIAPASVNGVTHVTWLARAISMIPCDIGTSSVSGELVLTIVNTLGSLSSCSAVRPRAMRTISITSMIALPAERVHVACLVGQREHVEAGVEVADRGVDVDRLDRDNRR